MRKRLFRENQAKNCQEIEELIRMLRTNRSSKTSNNWWVVHASREESYDCESILGSNSAFYRTKVNSLSSAREFYDPESGSSSGATHVSQSTLYSSESQDHASLRLLHDTRNFYGYFSKLFWTTTCSRRTNLYILQQFKEFGILLSRIETWYYRNYKETGEWHEKRTVEHVNPFTTLPKWRWNVESYWCDRLSELSDFGIASVEIS